MKILPEKSEPMYY